MSAGIVLGSVMSSFAADNKAEYVFGSLKTASVESAKNQSEAWLKSTGKMNEEAFAKVWANDELTVLDRVAETFKLGSPEAAKILSEAESAEKTAPKAVPAILKDEKQPAFFRSNLALAFAAHLSNARVYEEAMGALSTTKAEQVVDPSSYYFHKAVAAHALIKKDEAIKSIVHLLTDIADSDRPVRHDLLAHIMLADMERWKKDEKDLSNIVKLMDNSERRLDQSRAGNTTQEIQKKIVFRLDELIKEKEAQASQCTQCNGGSCPNGGKPGSKPSNTTQPSSPMQDSNISGGSGPGNVNDQKFKNLQEKWGGLEPAERAKALQELTRDYPPRFRPVIEEYFKAINRNSDANPKSGSK
jgi:hypothetical protein